MEKFMLLIREDLKKLRQSTEEQRSAEIKRMHEWTKSLAASGNLVHTDPLDATGRYVTKTQVLSDGPFIDAKEGIAGYYNIFAESINHAVVIAQSCPLILLDEAAIEVRPIIDPEPLL